MQIILCVYLGFTLPPDSGEKLSLGEFGSTSFDDDYQFCFYAFNTFFPFICGPTGVTILLSLTVFLNMVAGKKLISTFQQQQQPITKALHVFRLFAFMLRWIRCITTETMPATSDVSS